MTSAGIPTGLLEAVRSVLTDRPKAVRRRDLLKELEQRGHRVSLAGLNRVLDYGLRTELLEQGPEGVRLKPPG